MCEKKTEEKRLPLALWYLERTLKEGGSVEIPSLGVVIRSDKREEEKPEGQEGETRT